MRPLWVLVLAVAMAVSLLLAQSLGLLHRSAGLTTQAHPDASAQDHTHSHADVHANVHAHVLAHPHDGNLLGKLFAGHASDADCQIFDQLSFSDAASALLAVGLSLALTSALCTLLQGLACARWHAQFQARGPPFPR